MYLTFRLAQLLGRVETAEATDDERALVRLLTPIGKLLTARQAVEVTSESLEAHGGAGYIEDTGLPQLLRDAQVLTIWEGTTNVLALDLYRALEEGAEPLLNEIQRCHAATHSRGPRGAVTTARLWAMEAEGWRHRARDMGAPSHLGGARRYALAMGRALALALAAEHAQWAHDAEGDDLPMYAARRLAARLPDLGMYPISEARRLALDAGRAPS